jgi:hypothetical protein
MWGFGPIFELPTGGSIRGSAKMECRTIIGGVGSTWRLDFGGLINNAWSFAGNSDRGDVNHMLVNLFVVRQLGKGWYVNSAPIITADWTVDSEDRWIVPLGAGGGKVIMLGGKLPLNLQTQLYYNVVRPDFGPEWQWRVQAQFLLPTSILNMKFTSILAILSVALLFGCQQKAPELTPAEAQQIAKEAYIYGFPLVLNYKTMYDYAVDTKSPEYKGDFNELGCAARVYTLKTKRLLRQIQIRLIA